MSINKDQLLNHITNGIVQVQKHPTHNLFIYNYTKQAQYQNIWDETTKQTRGLILDENYNYHSRPFIKFFNYEEHPPSEIPNLPFKAYEKLDGSLGILYWIDDTPYIASRGSFTSEQAQKATELLHTKYKHVIPNLRKEFTYVFEIIYPQNRVVVDYGPIEDLYLLSIIHTRTHGEQLTNIGFPIPKTYDNLNDITAIKQLNTPNEEGFVIKFTNNFRVKVKFEEYIRLHRIVTQVSSKIIWEYLSQNKPLDELLERVPDEFYNWVKQTEKDLTSQFTNILHETLQNYKELPTRKDTALYFQSQPNPKLLFSILDKRDTSKLIWNLIKPNYSKPFTNTFTNTYTDEH